MKERIKRKEKQKLNRIKPNRENEYSYCRSIGKSSQKLRLGTAICSMTEIKQRQKRKDRREKTEEKRQDRIEKTRQNRKD